MVRLSVIKVLRSLLSPCLAEWPDVAVAGEELYLKE